ncbi:MAG: phosphate/phosphite/phosphonate ABC transporter substrate-binding protein [Candidatus Riflebacteria bacterium]|nr:phosphate/phosphite/phosphonate ABC transporter substrate-binding protein [Candidatus Riflebacteria bacterium]
MKKYIYTIAFLGIIIALISFSAHSLLNQKAKSGRFIFDNNSPIYFGIFPFLEKEILSDGLNPLMKYLSKHLKRRVELRFANDYFSLEEMAVRKKIHFFWFNPRSGYKNSRVSFVPFCRPVSASGKHYRGCVIVRKDSGINSVSELSGKSFAYIDRYSNSGFYYPNLLFAKMGIDPINFFGSVKFAGNHDKCFAGVLNREYDAGVVTDMLFQNSVSPHSTDTASLKIIATTASITLDPFAAAADTDKEIIEMVKNLLLNPQYYDESGPAFASLLSIFEIKGFQEYE